MALTPMPIGARCGRQRLNLHIPLSLKMIRLMCLPKAGPGLGWVGVILKVYEIDPLLCPSCGGQMKLIAFIEDPKAINKIICHLKITFQAERPPPSHVIQQELLMASEESREYF